MQYPSLTMRRTAALLLTLTLLLLASGCGGGRQRVPVRMLECTHPAALSGLFPAGGARAAVCWSDYEKESTTIQLVDAGADTIRGELTLDGIWDIRQQAFADGRFALCSRETNTWRFLSASLEELGTMEAENVDGFFSYDADCYYYISDHVLCCRSTVDGTVSRVPLSLDLRLLDILAYDAASGQMVVQFFLSIYSSECGTAVVDTATGEVTMLQKQRYQAAFTGEGLCLMHFDENAMGYSALYGSGDTFYFADAGIFQDAEGYLYAIPDSPYLMGVAGSSTLYAVGAEVTGCALAECGVAGEMHSSCYLTEEELLVGAVYQDGGFRLYAIDPAQLSFTKTADAAAVESPLAVDDALIQSYWAEDAGTPVAESLQEARQQADALEARYGVRILLSTQCREAAELCDMELTLTDTMPEDEELEAVNTALDALARCLALYPEGFPAQLRNGMGEGGLRFLLVAGIRSNYGAVGCTYENGDWQNVALDIRSTHALDSLICHEIWHATENCMETFLSDGWDAMNPPGFTYSNDPAESGSGQWTLYSGAPEDVYFVDGYACVNDREDRARIMEYFMVHEDEARLLIQSPAIREKLQVMCDAVRSNFNTDGWKNVRWEALLSEENA